MCDRRICGIRMRSPWMIRKKKGFSKLIEILYKGLLRILFVQLVHLPCIINVTPLYSVANSIHMHTLCAHIEYVNHVFNSLFKKKVKDVKQKNFQILLVG